MNCKWLPTCPDLKNQLLEAETFTTSGERWSALKALAKFDLDFPKTVRLANSIKRARAAFGEDLRGFQQVKLAILSSSTTSHLSPGIVTGGLSRGILFEIYEPDYGQARQEVSDPNSRLHVFAPNTILFAADPYSLFGAAGNEMALDVEQVNQSTQIAIDTLRSQWQRCRELWNATVIQQIPFNPFPKILGENEFRLPGSPASVLYTFQKELRAAALEDGVDLLDLEHWTTREGLHAWHSVSLWHRSKQEIHPSITPLYGDLIARIIAARYGRSAKCLVLDLDNTLWGGVIGDDGLEGIMLGQGSPIGESHIAFQQYAKMLSRRGIILAVCSKNDDSVAREPFLRHPEMVLRLDDISCFVANWTDKAANLRRIARELNIGIDSLVFADDNPFERELVRKEIPELLVPELGDDPSEYPMFIADSGYFEAASLTSEDLGKTAQYKSNAERQALLAEATNMDSYLSSLNMILKQGAFDEVGLSRIVQLINKTNQFNLTTKRYSEHEVRQLLTDTNAVTRQLRLVDRFGDNGIISILIASLDQLTKAMTIETWLMSCRVLGRQVEQASLNVLVNAARDIGANTIIGEYVATDRNGMVKDHFQKLGFSLIAEAADRSRWSLNLNGYVPHHTHIRIEATP